MEVSVSKADDISVEKYPIGVKERDTPPLVVAALNLKTVINHQQNVNEIAAASVVYSKGVKVRPNAKLNLHLRIQFCFAREADFMSERGADLSSKCLVQQACQRCGLL